MAITRRAICGFLTLLCGLAAQAAVSVYLPPEDLAARATLVVEATVSSSESGFDPTSGRLATYVTLDVLQVHRGPEDLERLTLREAGGRYAGWVQEIDAVPRYVVGERVLAFLEPARDGALRTVGMFFGKFRVPVAQGPRMARRDLGGHGRIRGAGLEPVEEFPLSDLLALTASSSPRPRPHRADQPGRQHPWLRVPSEMPRLVQDAPSEKGSVDPGSAALVSGALEGGASRFAHLESGNPTRWPASDSGTPVTIQVDPRNNPLGDDAAAVAEMARAMQAWTDVPEARIELRPGNTAYDYPGLHTSSPADAYTGTNVILFGDPYDDISDPSGCGGVLAIGGYWRSTTLTTVVNGVSFHPALQLYVVFNNAFECFLGDPDNLAEVAVHELGHGLGIGHSSIADAIMRSFAYGWGRGARLGDDDRDALHCQYPHQLTVLTPVTGASVEVGSYAEIGWVSTPEAGADSGVLDLQLSTDGGQSWAPLASDEPNDGSFDWLVPDLPGTDVRVRVLRPSRAGAQPAPFPSVCSRDASDGSFEIVSPSPVPGALDAKGGALSIERAAGGQLRLGWSASCSSDAVDHVVYEGSLDALRAGSWDALPVTCAAGADLAEYLVPGSGSRYYLVAPATATHEGTFGRDSSGAVRPETPVACFPREVSECPLPGGVSESGSPGPAQSSPRRGR